MSGLDLGLRHAPDEMRLHILGLWIECVVYITSDVEIVVVCTNDLRLVYKAAVFWELTLVGKDEVNLLYILRAELVLVLTLQLLRPRF
jgi:hypothetical protein